jgi:hypothetical protein
MGQEYFGSFLEYGPCLRDDMVGWNRSLEAWFEGISKLSVLNLEKPGMGDQMGGSLLEGKSQSLEFV